MTPIRCLKSCILESLLAATDALTSESLRTTEENDVERSEEPAVCGGIQSRIARPPAPTFETCLRVECANSTWLANLFPCRVAPFR